jgi:hypothetical protein
MIRLSLGVVCKSCFLLLLVSLAANSVFAQLETATVSGQVVDPSGLSITGAQVSLVDIDRDTTTGTTTTPSGLYTFPSVRPGRYRMQVTAAGFKVVNVTGMTVNVQDHLEQNFKLAVGSVSESITVEGGAPLVDIESAAVSTVVDRQFAENLPLNGRSFQTLIQLTPGVVLTTSNFGDSGQFSVNGQRAASNYWMVDGVSANIGIGAATPFNPGNGVGGAVGSFSALGGTNSLVSVDALQEFRIQTSTYAPEFGRTPGGQISIVTRSGANQFHGTAFDYLRNDVFDANNWFNGINILNPTPIPKAKERQNDFGGTFAGPIFKKRTFFFFSYEGLRLRLPQTTLTTVPDASFTPGGTANSRQNAIAALQPYLNAFPLPNPNSPEIFVPCDPATDPTCPSSGEKATGSAAFNASYSNPATLDAYSLRVDHKLNDNLNIFGRYNYSPSGITQRGSSGIYSLNTITPLRLTTQTATIGTTWVISPNVANDLRFNYSRTNASSYSVLDTFGGAVPPSSLPLPDSFTTQNAALYFDIFSLTSGQLREGRVVSNLQRQINLVENLSIQKGSHSLKIGVDFRRLSPLYDPAQYTQSAYFDDVPSAEGGSLSSSSSTASSLRVPLLFRNLGVFAQDTWRILPRLTLTYGVRWDVDFAPSTTSGPGLPAATHFNDLSKLALAPSGTPPFNTTYGNAAPRLGVAYQLFQNPEWGTVLRGGFGVFFDLATEEVGNTFQLSYPFGAINSVSGNFPLDPATAAPPPITPSNLVSGLLAVFYPHLQLPYTLEWNIAIEQALGKRQTLSGSYIGSVGRRLMQTAEVFSLSNPNIGNANLISNAATSDYNALQFQFQRRLTRGLQALASYTWSHSIDTASAGSYANASNLLVPTFNPNSNRGPSDFDIRNAFSAGLTYNIPTPGIDAFAGAILRDWSLENIVQVRSAPPVDIDDANFFVFNGGFYADVRPDLVPGNPLYLYGSQYPGGKAFNPSAFTNPPTDPSTGNPLRQGDLGRNALRGFGATQWDFAVHRDFAVHESLKLQFRAEMFNVLNHPNFGPPYPFFGLGGFGVSNLMLGQSLSGGNVGGGGFGPLYQIGGPRSIQLALKLSF